MKEEIVRAGMVLLLFAKIMLSIASLLNNIYLNQFDF
jgi:hypothetical protein